MKVRFPCVSVLIICLILGQISLAAEYILRRPNIIVFLADDLGYGELGCQGNSEIPTPYIDSIAKAGIRFSNGYVSAPVCSPTRAGLMTGRYQTRFGHEFNGGDIFGGEGFGLPVTETTIADRLKSIGYKTCAIGTWHLGGPSEYLPMRRGFDEFFGTVGKTSFFRPRAFVDSRMSPQVHKVTDRDFYTTDAYAERAVEWLEKQGDKPFFLYLAFNASTRRFRPRRSTSRGSRI